jgi:hypothetical protein
MVIEPINPRNARYFLNDFPFARDHYRIEDAEPEAVPDIYTTDHPW